MGKNLLVVFERDDRFYRESAENFSYFAYFIRKVDAFSTRFGITPHALFFDEGDLSFLGKCGWHHESFVASQSFKAVLEKYEKIVSADKEGYTLLISSFHPLFSMEKNAFMYDDAPKFFIEYYYGEGFPEGYIGELIRHDMLPELIRLATDNDRFRPSLIFDIALRNISSFDLDFLEGMDDYVRWRTSLSVNDPVNVPMLRWLLTGKKESHAIDRDFFSESLPLEIPFDDLYERMKSAPELLRTIPKTVIFEPSAECDFLCIHCPHTSGLKRNRSKLNLAEITRFCESNAPFLTGAVYILGGFGEPFNNPELPGIIDYLCRKNRLFVETNGASLSVGFIDSLHYRENVTFVVMIDAATEETYKLLGKTFLYPYLERIVGEILEKYPENIKLSYTRMKDNDLEIERFYEKYSAHEKRIIFRKYNSYAKRLPEKEIGDLTPMVRFPCYHLRRDLFILSDGRVSLCMTDFNGERTIGTMDESLPEILAGSDNIYKSHVNGVYPPPCDACNEFYTWYF